MSPIKRPSTTHLRGDFAGTFSLAQAATRLHMTSKHLRAELAAGRLAFTQIRGQLRIPTEEVTQRLRNSAQA